LVSLPDASPVLALETLQMALSLQNPLLVKQKTLADTRKPKIQLLFKALFSYLAQHKGNPDLQLVPFALASSTSIVIADAACKVVGVYVKKPAGSTTSAFFKLTDDETTASATAGALLAELRTNNEELLLFPDGLAMASGVAVRSDTTSAGATGSVTADQPSGFVIIAAP
jgi:hypothetical protein